MESPGSEHLIDSVEGVVAGNAARQLDVLLEPVVLGVAEVLDVIETLAAADNPA